MLGYGEIFTLFFVTLGPQKVLGPFAKRTHGLDEAAVRKISLLAFAVATMAVIGVGDAGVRTTSSGSSRFAASKP